MGQKPAVILYCQSDKQSNPNEKPRSKTYEKPNPIQTKNQDPKPTKNPIQSKRKTRSKTYENPNPNLPKTTGDPILETSNNLI